MDNQVGSAKGDNSKVVLLREGYEAAKKAAEAECLKGAGRRCREAEATATKARDALAAKPVERVENSMALRLSIRAYHF